MSRNTLNRSTLNRRSTSALGQLTAILTGIVMFATGCIGTGDSARPIPTPDRESPTLLPAVTAESVDDPASGSSDTSPVATVKPRGPTLACLGPRTRYAQLLLPLAVQSELAAAVELATAGDLGGLGLLGSPDDALAGLLSDLQTASFVPILVASDEEGGDVQRLANLLGPMPSAITSATTRSPEEVQAQWLEYGARVKALGIDVVFGPVLDVGPAPGIGSRSFGTDPAVVTAYGRAVADGLSAAGILPVFKHFPGHGRASGDSHLGLPVVPSLDQLRLLDLIPYVDLVGGHQRDQAAVMVGHLSVPGLSGDLATSLSPDTINGLLKNEIGFGGLVFTDAMNMGAIVDTYGPLEALELSFNAGVDIAILGSLADVTPALDHLGARAAADPGFAAILETRVDRVMEAKGQTTICQGAQ